MSDEVDYLLSILDKEGYGAMDCWMPTNPADKNDAGKFLNYLERTLDDEISPHVIQHRLILAIVDSDIELQELFQVSWDKGVTSTGDLLYILCCWVWNCCNVYWLNHQCSTEVQLTSKATTEASLTVLELHMLASTWAWWLPCLRICLQRLLEERTLASQESFQQEKTIHWSSGQPIKRYIWLAWKEGEEDWPHRSPYWGTTM